MLLIFDQVPDNVAASTSKVNTIESLPVNKKSDCVCPLKRIDMPLLARGQKITLEHVNSSLDNAGFFSKL